MKKATNLLVFSLLSIAILLLAVGVVSAALTLDTTSVVSGGNLTLTAAGANTLTVGTSTGTTTVFSGNWSVSAAGLGTLATLNLGTTNLLDVISATATLNFAGAATPNACQEQDKAVTGAAQGDSVVVSPGNFNLAAHHILTGFASATDAVTIRDCFATSSLPTDPDGGAGAPFYRITILKFLP